MDNDILVSILDEATNILNLINSAKKILEKLPFGSIVLHTSHNGKYKYFYHHYSIDHKSFQKRLKLSESEIEEFRSKLALRREYQTELKQGQRFMQQNMNLLKACYKHISQNHLYWTFRTFPLYQSENTYYKEKLIHRTAKGEYVRSRAEVILADALASCRIPYRYEQALSIENHLYYPDFTTINPLSGKPVYIEYCGMDTAEYEDRLQKKLQAYSKFGIREGKQLIIIREYNMLMDSKSIRRLIENFFTLRRFTPLTHWLRSQICDRID